MRAAEKEEGLWEFCEGPKSVGRYEGLPWRVVEAQHIISTRKLVESDEEQRLLEELIERGKPPLPADDAASRLHYLLFTPFRYPPLRHGSRFASRWEPSLWYGSEEVRTAFAEVAYYRLLFLEGTEAQLSPIFAELSAFQVRVRSKAAVDLTQGKFAEYQAALRSRRGYEATQALGAAARGHGVEVLRYASAREPGGGINVALFSPAAFAEKRPRQPQTWSCVVTKEIVEFTRKSYFVQECLSFPRELFEEEGVLPTASP